MYIPLLRERVRVRARSREFIVLRADYVRRSADVTSTSGSKELIEGVQFDNLYAHWEHQVSPAGESQKTAQPQWNRRSQPDIKGPSAPETS